MSESSPSKSLKARLTKAMVGQVCLGGGRQKHGFWRTVIRKIAYRLLDRGFLPADLDNPGAGSADAGGFEIDEDARWLG